jgi:hypothetical protein
MLKTARAVAVVLSAGATSLTLASPAWAQEEYAPPPTNPPAAEQVPPPSSAMANRGLQFGARIGYAYGSGIVYSGFSLPDGSSGAMPLIGDLGWRFLPQLYVGLYGQYAPVFTKTNAVECFDGFNCATQDYRFGIQVDYHPVPRSRFDPYVGLGGGYEILHTRVSGPTVVPTPGGFVPAHVDVSAIDRGWEYFSVIVGFDGRIDPAVGLGLFASFSLSEYNVHTGTQTVSVGGTTVSSGPIPDRNHGMHEIYIAGVRGTFNPMTW